MNHFSRSRFNSFLLSPVFLEDTSYWNERDLSHTLSSYHHPTSSLTTNRSNVSYSYDTLRLSSSSNNSVFSTVNNSSSSFLLSPALPVGYSNWNERDDYRHSSILDSCNSFLESPAFPGSWISLNERDDHRFSSTFNSRTVPSSSSFHQSSSTSISFNNSSHHSSHQPVANPHERFFNRSEETCPKDLTGGKRTRWLKAGKKAELNQQLLASLPVFQWPVEYYGTPIHLHRRTPESVIISLTQQLQNIEFYVIDTESDKPTKTRPKPLPSLIQIQVISNKKLSTVILIEVQHLPHPNSSSFKLINNLCDFIFSPDHTIMAWGEVTDELKPFQSFHLFNLSKITRTFNIQKLFAKNWNNQHPHTLDCLNNSSSKSPTIISTDFLICHVDTDDLNDDIQDFRKNNDHHLCICPEHIRPYKAKNQLWSLQKALELTFNQALDKSMTMNLWSCGLDKTLGTWKTFEDQCARDRLILYAINDLFVSTILFFHLDFSHLFNNSTSILTNLNMISNEPAPPLPLYLVISDSHTKFLPPLTITSSYQLIVKSVSGLQWVNDYNQQLSALSLIQTPTISSYLSSAKAVMFIIGTNSTRSLSAAQILPQIENIIYVLRNNHPNLVDKNSINIVATFPCNKTSYSFPSCRLLEQNISLYNEKLSDLANNLHFNTLNFQITHQHLSPDNIHIDFRFRDLINNSINTYFHNLSLEKPPLKTKNKNRSCEAKTRRNKLRHQRQQQKQKQFHISRSIEFPWTLKHIKDFLQKQQIKFAKLPPIHKKYIRIQFNNTNDLTTADKHLPKDIFSEKLFAQWFFS